MSEKETKKWVYEVFDMLTEEFNLQTQKLHDDTPVFAAGGITSLQLVRLIVELEDRILEETGVMPNLTDDKVLSQKHSPYASLGSLVPFVEAKIQEAS